MKAAFSKAVFESEMTSRFATAFKPRAKPTEVIPTGIASVDFVIGGFPRGAITEIFGLTSSGRTTLILSALASATDSGEVCAWVDTSDVFHPASAATAGASLDRVLWIRCDSKLEHAFKATDLLLQGGGFGFVFLDLGDVPARDSRRIISSWWYRFRRVVENTPTALVVMAQDSCVRSCATMTLEMKRSNNVWSLTQRAGSSSPIPLRFPVPEVSTSSPTHSNLLTGIKLQLERHKPIHAGDRQVLFGAAVSHRPLDSFR